jgi:hypothetical protein
MRVCSTVSSCLICQTACRGCARPIAHTTLVWNLRIEPMRCSLARCSAKNLRLELASARSISRQVVLLHVRLAPAAHQRWAARRCCEFARYARQSLAAIAATTHAAQGFVISLRGHEVSLRKRAARSRLQVPLQAKRFRLGRKLDRHHYRSGTMRDGVADRPLLANADPCQRRS